MSAVWALGLFDLCPLDYGRDGRMFVHKGCQDLSDLDLEVSSLHEQTVSAFVRQGDFEGLPAHAAGEFRHLRAIRVGVHVSMGARQAVRAVGSALGVEAPRVNTVTRQVPLLSSTGAIENVHHAWRDQAARAGSCRALRNGGRVDGHT